MRKLAAVAVLILGTFAVSSSVFARAYIAPEPISAGLFLLGGAGLVARKILSKKNDK